METFVSWVLAPPELVPPSLTHLSARVPERTTAWLAIPVAVLLVAALSSVRIVAEGHRLVVTRLGRPARVTGPGLSFHLPLVERVTLVSLQSNHLFVRVPAVTRDGVDVRVTGTATSRIIDPGRTWAADPDPATATVSEVEAVITRAISRIALLDLLPAREHLESSVPAEVCTRTAAWGVRVETLQLADVETRLTAQLLHENRTHGDEARDPENRQGTTGR